MHFTAFYCSSYKCLSISSYWTPSTTKLYFVDGFLFFGLQLGVSTGKLSHSFFQMFFVSSWLWPHPLTSEHPIVRAFDHADSAPPDPRLPTVPEMVSLQGKRSPFFTCFVQERRKIAHLMLAKPSPSQLRQLQQSLCAVIQKVPSHIPPFLLTQNVSTKWIVPADNM